jgi:hypothetical protein
MTPRRPATTAAEKSELTVANRYDLSPEIEDHTTESAAAAAFLAGPERACGTGEVQ